MENIYWGDKDNQKHILFDGRFYRTLTGIKLGESLGNAEISLSKLKKSDIGVPNGCTYGQDFTENKCLTEKEIEKIEKAEPTSTEKPKEEMMFCTNTNAWIHLDTGTVLAEKVESEEMARERLSSLKKAIQEFQNENL